MTTAPAWINPFDSQCPRTVAKIGMPVLRLASSILDEMPDRPQKWAASIALGTSNCAGWTLAGIAAKCGSTELELLKAATSFCQRHGVHPSPYLQRFAALHAAAKKSRPGTKCHDSGEDAPQGTLEGKDGR